MQSTGTGRAGELGRTSIGSGSSHVGGVTGTTCRLTVFGPVIARPSPTV